MPNGVLKVRKTDAGFALEISAESARDLALRDGQEAAFAVVNDCLVVATREDRMDDSELQAAIALIDSRYDRMMANLAK